MGLFSIPSPPGWATAAAFIAKGFSAITDMLGRRQQQQMEDKQQVTGRQLQRGDDNAEMVKEAQDVRKTEDAVRGLSDDDLNSKLR